MSSSESLKCGLRDKVGSRDARKLRSQGRIPASIQAEGKNAHMNIHLAADEFHASRRHHVHLYDLDVDGDVHTAVVRELQWDVMGDHLNHIEFRPVQRGVAIESQVTLLFNGQVKDAVLSQNVTEITISCIPSLIPDNLEVGQRDPMLLLNDLDRLDYSNADVVVLSACVQMPSLPALEDAELVQQLAGSRPLSPDTFPIIGPMPGWEGVILATGHGTKGVHLGPVTGRTLAEYVMAGCVQVPELLEAFSPARFSAESDPDFYAAGQRAEE